MSSLLHYRKIAKCQAKEHLRAFYQGYLEFGNKCTLVGKWTIEEGKKERRNKKRKEKKRKEKRGPTVNMLYTFRYALV